MLKRIGRPPKYVDDYAKQLIEFFNVPPTRISTKIITTKNGTTIEEETVIANKMPYIVEYCMKVGISKDTFHRWVQQHRMFSDAYSRAKELQERHLAENALNNTYNAGFASLAAKNWLGWKDKTEVEQETTHVFKVNRGTSEPHRALLSSLNNKKVVDIIPEQKPKDVH